MDGAFTGAKRGGKKGKFQLANGGTIFLDEIGDMPSSMQAKLLRVLQEKEIEPLGSEKSIPLDVRVVAATRQDLEAKMKNLDQISDSLNSYSEVSRIQKWMLVVAFIVVLILFFVIYYMYKVYRKKLQKQKLCSWLHREQGGWAAELNHLDESDRYFMDRFKKKILENMGNADMKMDDLGAQMQLSKVQLYRKVKAMTGKNACRAPERDAPAESLYPLAAN